MVYKVLVCRFFLTQDPRRSGRLSASATSQRSASRTGGARSKTEETKRLQPVVEEASTSKKKKLSKK